MENKQVQTSIQLPETMSPEEIVGLLRAVQERIPEFTQLTVPDKQAIRRLASVNADFVQATINTIAMSDRVEGALGLGAADARKQADEARDWTAVEDELQRLLKGVMAGNLVRRHRVGLTALQTYKICRELARKKDNSALLSQLDTMKHLNKFGPRKRAKSAPAPQTPEAPAPKVTETPKP